MEIGAKLVEIGAKLVEIGAKFVEVKLAMSPLKHWKKRFSHVF